MKKFFLKPAFFVILGIVLGLGGFFLILANPFGWKSIQPNLNISQPGKTGTDQAPKGLATAPTPVLILPSGKQTYNVSGGTANVSRVTQLTVDPLDVKKGGTQTISMKVTSKEPVESFTITLNSDNGSKDFPLKLVSGDASQGVWEGTYTVSDSTAKVYNFVFNIITNSGNKTVSPFLVR